MSFVADESLDSPIIEALRKGGYDVFSIREQSPGVDDKIVLQIAKEQDRTLLTSDKDFGELVFRLKLVSSGIVLFRIPELSNTDKASVTLDFISRFKDRLSESFCVVTAQKIRIVGLK